MERPKQLSTNPDNLRPSTGSTARRSSRAQHIATNATTDGNPSAEGSTGSSPRKTERNVVKSPKVADKTVNKTDKPKAPKASSPATENVPRRLVGRHLFIQRAILV
ncbi:unnamed protein product [Anisakis simplex]|uniref:Uncharacterized protein n=1 Tax=Anisakis simplex TaxID=6269 RepID=A0A0M3JEF9_ANISI|nr:unnamed protein product [Anisakis simplex]